MNHGYPTYFMRLVKENFWYILVLSVLVTAFIAIQIVFFGQMNNYSSNYDTLITDVNDLKSNTDYLLLRKKIMNEGYDLDKINPILAQLLPQTEDYFSIVIALERISQKSQFIINSYSLRLSTGTKERLSFQIKGQGDQNKFLEFLKEYNFGGGRLVTIDKINFSRQGSSNDSLIDLNFYNSSLSKSQAAPKHVTFTTQDQEFVKKILQKVTIEVKRNETQDVEYETKVNPF